jgi:hypothetical protein
VVDPEDIVDIPGISPPPPQRDEDACTGPRRKFLSIWFRCCHAYGRLYRNRAQTAYEGRCPRCGARARARIGPNGTTQRMFAAR